MKNELTLLLDIADVKPGYPFRGQIQDTPDGLTKVVQMKHINEMSGVAWQNLAKANLEGRKEPNYLAKGDIIFSARGNKNFAVCLNETPEKAVCSPHFFQIHIKNTQKVLPSFLAWQINQAPAQKYLINSAEGTMIRSIRKGILELLPIVIPEMKKQKAIAKLDSRVKQEYTLLQKQINNSRTMMNAIARDLVK